MVEDVHDPDGPQPALRAPGSDVDVTVEEQARLEGGRQPGKGLEPPVHSVVRRAVAHAGDGRVSQDDIHRAGGALPAGPVQQPSHPSILLARRVLIGTSSVSGRATQAGDPHPGDVHHPTVDIDRPGRPGRGDRNPGSQHQPPVRLAVSAQVGVMIAGHEDERRPGAIRDPAQQVERHVATTRHQVRLVVPDLRCPEALGHLVGDGQDPHRANLPIRPGGIIFAVLYDVLVAVHVVSAVVGFGALARSGVYGATARRADRHEAREETARYFRSPGRAEWLIVPVPFLGAAALGARPEGADFGAVWVITAAVVWSLATALLFGVVRPAERRIRCAAEVGAVAAAGRRLMWAAVASDVLFVAALVLMVGQPT
jgi:hypothetical protein